MLGSRLLSRLSTRLRGRQARWSLGIALLLITGCRGVHLVPAEAAGDLNRGAIRGGIHGGNQPVAGAHVYLLAAGTSNAGASSVSLLDPTITGAFDGHGAYVVTDGSGGFSITGDYQCPQGDAQVYLLALGGDPGLGTGLVNPDLALMTGLGSCAALLANASTTVLNVSEVTTVVTAFQLSGFMASSFALSTDGSSSQKMEIASAFSSIRQMADVTTGLARQTTIQGDAIVPTATINTLADVLASCVNSVGSASDPNGTCAILEQDTTFGSVMPQNTVDVVLSIASHPAQNTGLLLALAAPEAPFQPSLGAAPADFSLGLIDPGTLANCLPNCTIYGVNAGGGAAGLYRSDENYLYGITGGNSQPVALDAVIDSAPESVYQTERYGSLFYYFPGGYVPGSAHLVRLHFSENYWQSSGARSFSVSINGTPVLRSFDIFAEAGGGYRAITRSFVVTAADDGTITLAFYLGADGVDNAKLDAFDVR